MENKVKVESESSSNPLSVKTCRANIYSSLEESWTQDNFWDTPD